MTENRYPKPNFVSMFIKSVIWPIIGIIVIIILFKQLVHLVNQSELGKISELSMFAFGIFFLLVAIVVISNIIEHRHLLLLNYHLLFKISDTNNRFLLACEHGRPELIKWLLGSGADINSLDDDGNSALHLVIKNDIFKSTSQDKYSVEILDFLLSNNCKQKNTKNKNGDTPLHLSLKLDNLKSFDRFLSSGCDLTIKDGDDVSLLENAVRRKKMSFILSLFKCKRFEFPLNDEGNKIREIVSTYQDEWWIRPFKNYDEKNNIVFDYGLEGDKPEEAKALKYLFIFLKGSPAKSGDDYLKNVIASNNLPVTKNTRLFFTTTEDLSNTSIATMMSFQGVTKEDLDKVLLFPEFKFQVQQVN